VAFGAGDALAAARRHPQAAIEVDDEREHDPHCG
jgi:hypothetical protein